MTQSNCEDVLADFVHQLRQPLSALEALTSYLDLITTPEDARVHEQLRRMHLEIGHADQIIRDGLRALRDCLPNQGRSLLADVPVTPPCEKVVEELTRPLTSAAMASLTY